MSQRRINPALKKVLAAVAVKQVVDRIQEARAPRKSFLRRNFGKLAFVAVGVTGFYAYKSGKIDQLLGGSSRSTDYRDDYPTGPGTEPIGSSTGETGGATSSERPLEPSRA